MICSVVSRIHLSITQSIVQCLCKKYPACFICAHRFQIEENNTLCEGSAELVPPPTMIPASMTLPAPLRVHADTVLSTEAAAQQSIILSEDSANVGSTLFNSFNNQC